MQRGLIKNREQAQIFTGVFSIAVNAVLFIVKIWAGVTTGSIALVADAWHTMSDSLTSVLTVVAAKLASRKPDKEHPFGHGRWEVVASFIMAFVLAFIGYEFLTGSIDRFNDRETVVFGTLALSITIVSIAVKELLAQFSFYLGRKYNNPVIIAEGWHSRSDSLSSIVVLAGIVITRFFTGLWWMDSVLGIFCALAIFYAAFKVMKESIKNILGEEPKQELIDELRNEVEKICDIDVNLHHFHLHNYITHKELTFHMKLDGQMTVNDGHKIATVIENMILEKFEMDATIHIEPGSH